MARESWTTIENGYIVKHSENDGWSFVRRGPEADKQIIISVKEAKEKGVYRNLIKEFEESNSEELNEVE